MASELESKILEFAELAQKCPERFQEKCFEVLLQQYLSGQTKPSQRQQADQVADPDAEQVGDVETDVTSDGQEDIAAGDLHVKARRFLERSGISLEELNQIFYKEGSELLPLYDDLGTTRLAESQTRIALLQALRAGLPSGEFAFDGEEVRAEAQLRKCYDAGNFATNFKNNAALFDGFTKYDRKHPSIRLSERGRGELAQLIRELL